MSTSYTLSAGLDITRSAISCLSSVSRDSSSAVRSDLRDRVMNSSTTNPLPNSQRDARAAIGDPKYIQRERISTFTPGQGTVNGVPPFGHRARDQLERIAHSWSAVCGGDDQLATLDGAFPPAEHTESALENLVGMRHAARGPADRDSGGRPRT